MFGTSSTCVVLSDRCAARIPGWLCALNAPANSVARQCNAGHPMVRYTTPVCARAQAEARRGLEAAQ